MVYAVLRKRASPESTPEKKNVRVENFSTNLVTSEKVHETTKQAGKKTRAISRWTWGKTPRDEKENLRTIQTACASGPKPGNRKKKKINGPNLHRDVRVRKAREGQQ